MLLLLLLGIFKTIVSEHKYHSAIYAMLARLPAFCCFLYGDGIERYLKAALPHPFSFAISQ